MKSLNILLITFLACGLIACGGEKKVDEAKKEKPSHAGTYKLDTDALIKSLSDTEKEETEDVVGVSEEDKKAMADMMKNMFGASTGTLVLMDDKTFSVEAVVGPVPIKAKGTYVIEGDAIQLTVTEKEGDDSFDINGMKGKIKDGVINIERDKSLIIPLTLKRI